MPNNQTVTVTTEADNEYEVTGEWDHPKFHIESIYLEGSDVTDSVKVFPKLWGKISNLSLQACIEVQQERSDYLRDLQFD
jgi:hypothetical protein